MRIRTADQTDIETLSLLFDNYRIFYNKNTDIAAAKSFLLNRMKNEESVIYVCELENHILAGFVQLYPYFSSTNLQRLWMLNDLYVDPAHRGKGISVQLIEKAQQLAINTGAHALMLETEKDNDIGNKLYPKTGFKLHDAVNFYEWKNLTNG